MQPRVTDNDDGEIIVSLRDKEIRCWSYSTDDERRKKMLLAREYVEGWCDGAATSSPPHAMTRAARYSGQAGQDICDRIEALDHEPAHALLCIAACALQEHEQRFLQMLVSAESHQEKAQP